ncbi:MAG: tRNA (pseudouridine(54)-N(1))-methyltransferase TrmY [Candidatus Thermoplasmatota archaeon]
MRRFIVLGHETITSSNFNLNDLSGSTGRLDILLRAVNSAFFISHGIRKDTELFLILLGEPHPPKTIKLVGANLKYLFPDERNIGSLIRNALMKKCDFEEKEATPGIFISKKSFSDVLEMSKDSDIVYLKESGEDIRNFSFSKDVTFVLGGEKDLTDEEENLLLRYKPKIISLGKKNYHADHCIVILNWLLDNYHFH